MDNKRKTFSYEEKFNIMYKFIEENNFNTNIKSRTKFGEYPIGQWQANMRRAYYRDELKIDPELETKFLKLGILREEKQRKTADKMSWEEKYLIMEEFLKEGKQIKSNTVYKGYKIGQWQIVIRHLLYTDSLATVSPELKSKFFKLGILKKGKDRLFTGGSKKLSYDEKFEIMLKYLENTNFEKEIKQKTTFNGNRIGVWQDNLRQTYRKGRDLEISPELLKKFFDYGILREKDKKIRQSKDYQKGTIKSGKKLINNSEESIEQIVEKLLKKQEERKALDLEIEQLQDLIKAKTDSGFEI